MLKKYIVITLALVLLIATVKWTCQNLTLKGSSPAASTAADVIGQLDRTAPTGRAVQARWTPTLDEQIAALDQDLQGKESAIQSDGIVDKLNRRDLSERERQAFFAQLEDAARVRLRDIELRLQRVQKVMHEKGGA